MSEPRRRDLLWIAGACLLVGAALSLDIGIHNPEYLHSAEANANPDAKGMRTKWAQGQALQLSQAAQQALVAMGIPQDQAGNPSGSMSPRE